MQNDGFPRFHSETLLYPDVSLTLDEIFVHKEPILRAIKPFFNFSRPSTFLLHLGFRETLEITQWIQCLRELTQLQHISVDGDSAKSFCYALITHPQKYRAIQASEESNLNLDSDIFLPNSSMLQLFCVDVYEIIGPHENYSKSRPFYTLLPRLLKRRAKIGRSIERLALLGCDCGNAWVEALEAVVGTVRCDEYEYLDY